MNEIKKTYKNYVGGKYVRSESGKTFRIELKNQFYEVPLTSRKDVRDAVVAAKKRLYRVAKTNTLQQDSSFVQAI